VAGVSHTGRLGRARSGRFPLTVAGSAFSAVGGMGTCASKSGVTEVLTTARREWLLQGDDFVRSSARYWPTSALQGSIGGPRRIDMPVDAMATPPPAAGTLAAVAVEWMGEHPGSTTPNRQENDLQVSGPQSH